MSYAIRGSGGLYSGHAVIVFDGGFHGVDVELTVDTSGPLLDWGGIAKVTEPLVGHWSALVGTEVDVILPGPYVANAIVIDLVYSDAGAARSRLVGKGRAAEAGRPDVGPARAAYVRRAGADKVSSLILVVTWW